SLSAQTLSTRGPELMKLLFHRWSPAHLPIIQPNSFGAYIVIHKIHLMNLKNAATLVPDAAR
ncbi:MAG: hypothetical protein WA510_19140, partial [Acidobacteriaceae bacterium]